MASASPRRIELLEAAGQRFDVEASGFREERDAGEEALGFVARMAREKASEVAARRARRWVLAADTVVIVDEEPLGKPNHVAAASVMLRRLSGRAHEVATGFVLLDPDRRVFDQQIVQSRVVFRRLSHHEIEAYVATGEPLDKAGGYAIQGGGATFIREIRGSHSNVVGLPMAEVEAVLRRAGLWSDSGPRRE